MSFWDDLLKGARGVVAQVNPFDGGEDFNSVVNGRARSTPKITRSPAVEVRAKAPVRVAAATGRSFGNGTLKLSAPSSLNTNSPISMKKMGVFTPENPKLLAPSSRETVKIDGIGTYTKNKNGTFTGDKGQIRTQKQINAFKSIEKNHQARLSKIANKPMDYVNDVVGAPARFANDVVIKPTVETAKKAVNTVSAPITGVTGLTMAGADNVFNGGRNAADILNATKAQMNENIDNSFISRRVAEGRANPLEFAKEFTNAGVETASIMPVGRALTAIKGASSGLTKEAVRDIIKTNSKMAGVYGTASTTNDVMQGRGINPESVAANYGAPLLLGAGSESLGVGAKQLSRYIRNLPQETRNKALIEAADGSQAVKVPIEKLTTYEDAPDIGRIEEYRARIRNGGEIEPILLMPDETGRLVVEDGKHRLAAAMAEGRTDINSHIVSPDRLRRVLDPLNDVNTRVAADDANIVGQIDASQSNPSIANPVLTKVSSSDQIVPPRVQALQAEAKARGIDVSPEAQTVDVVNPKRVAMEREAVERGLINARRLYEETQVSNQPDARDIQMVRRQALEAEAARRNMPVVSDRSFEDLTPAQRKLIKNELEAILANENPEIMAKLYGMDADVHAGRMLSEDGSTSIPRMHVDDLRQHLGELTSDIPVHLRRRTGDRDLDQLAARAGFDNVDDFIEAVQSTLATKRNAAELDQLFKESMRDPDNLKRARANLENNESVADLADAWKESNTRHLRIKGQNAKPNEYLVPVSTPKSRTIDVKVTGPRGNKVTEYVAAPTLDDAGKSSYELIPLDKTRHELNNGMVVDKDGKSVGSYVGIDEMGNQYAYVEGKPVNINGIIGDVAAWGNLNKATWDMDRLIELNAPNKNIARKVQNFTTAFKDQQEAVMKTDLVRYRSKLQEVERDLYKKLPKGVQKKELTQDLFRMMEGKPDMNEMRAKYGDDYFENQIKPTLKWAREQFDEILDNTNRVLERNGFDPIPRRDNYITHIQEDPKFWEKVGIGIQDLNPFGSSISSDINPGKVRGAIPEEIVGNTANTSARKRWNPFAQTRRGDAAKHDFFAAVDSYYEPMLFNQYMTPAASRARIIEKAFRTYEKAQDIKYERMAEIVGIDEAKKARAGDQRNHSKYKADRSSPLITAWQEYGNILAGKTNAWDRTIIDKGGDKGRTLLSASTKLQGIAGASSIPGSTTAALAQILSVPQTLARDSSKSALLAVRDMFRNMGADDPLRKSNFMRVRYTDATSKRKSLMRKYTSVASKPMETIERETGEFSWRSAYHQAKGKGFTEADAIRAADIVAKKTLAGRGVGDRPLAMNSKAAGIITQFGLEVNNMRIQFWNDFTPAQKIKFMVGVSVLNTVYGAVTGQTPLPDYIKAAIDTYGDLTDSSDDGKDTFGTNLVQGGQRIVGQTSKFIPGASTLTSMFLSDREREDVFGKGSEVSRFGTPALSGPIRSGFDTTKSLAEGDIAGAAEGALGFAPTGSQIKRTAGGIDALQKGYVESGSGRVNNEIDNTNPVNWAQGAAFGKYALPGQQEAMDRGQSLGDKQSAKYKELLKVDKAAANQYFEDTMAGKRNSDRAGTLTDTGYGAIAKASDSPISMAELEVDKRTKLAEGDWKEVNGTIVHAKSGNVVSSYYKELLKNKTDQSDETYENYVKAYGLTTQGQKTKASTGDKNLDKLNEIDGFNDQLDTVDQAIALLKKSKNGYSDIPSWVTDRYMEKNKIKKEDALYAAKSSYNNATKLRVVLSDIKGKKHDKVLDYLAAGRLASVKDTYWVTTGVLRDLRDRGIISKSEYTALYRTKFNKQGKNISKYAARGGNGKRTKTVSANDLKLANATTDIEKQLAKILKEAGQVVKPKKISYKRRT